MRARCILYAMAIALLGISPEASASRLRINGLVTDYCTSRPMAHARVRIYKDGRLLQVQASGPSGRYSFTFENNGSYVVRVDAPGYQGKCIALDTRGADRGAEGGTSMLEVEMRLPALHPDIDLSFLDLPLGVARFEPATGRIRWSRAYARSTTPDAREVMARYEGLHAEFLLPVANRRGRTEVPMIRL